MLAPWWRVQAVELSGCPGLPAAVKRSLQDLVGRSTLTVNPQWVRNQVEVWPVVESVNVRLHLPATLRISAKQVEPHGSVPVGCGWQAVAEDGSLAGSIRTPRTPVLEGFDNRPEDLRRALRVARRVETASGGRVDGVRFVTPADFEVRVRLTHGTLAVVHVGAEETAGERYWSKQVSSGEASQLWADLRWEDRVVVGGGR
jgi:hypothetical protein